MTRLPNTCGKQFRIVFLVVFFSALCLYARCQPPDIRQDFRHMDSLWNANQYTRVLEYAAGIEEKFIRNNSYPYYVYFRLLVDYEADALKENGQLGEAEEKLQNAIRIIGPILPQIHPAHYNALYALGELYLQSGRFSRAYDCFTQAWKGVAIFRGSAPSKFIELGSYLVLICGNTGRYDQAEYYSSQVEQSIKTMRYDNDDLASFYISEAVYYMQALAVQKAEVYLNKAIPLLSPPVNIYTKTELTNALSMALAASGRQDSALLMLKELLVDLRKKKMTGSDPYFLTVSNFISASIAGGGSFTEDSLLEEAAILAKTKKSKYAGALYESISMLKVRSLKYEEALHYIDSAITLFNSFAPEEMQYYLPAGILKSVFLFKLQRYQQSYVLYDSMMSLYGRYIRSNITHLSQLEKNTVMLSYYNMANFAPSFLEHSSFGPPDEINNRVWQQRLFYKELAGRTQSKLFHWFLTQSDSAVFQQYTEWQEIKSFLENEYKKPALLRSRNLDSVALLAEKKEKKILQSLPGKLISGSMDQQSEIYKSLRPGEAIIDYTEYSRLSSAGTDSVYIGAFVLQKGNQAPAFIPLCSQHQLYQTLHSSVSRPGMQSSPQVLYPSGGISASGRLPGKKLFDLLWKPIEKKLERDIKTVFISSDGIVNSVAFHALSAGNGRYLSDYFNIRYLYHPADKADSLIDIPGKISGIQLWGGINYDSVSEPVKRPASPAAVTDVTIKKNWTALPATLKEVTSVAAIAASRNIPVEIYSGAAATESSFKKNYNKGAAIIHIATHGRFDTGYYSRQPDFKLYSNLPFTLSKNPMNQVALVMAGRNILQYQASSEIQTEDGLLNAGEIQQISSLDNKQLVVLSACESGLGEAISTEGVYGMVRAFKITGVKKVLVSLWNIPDEETKEFMAIFYRSLLGGQPAWQALHEAQQYMQKKYPPYYWGGFMLVE